MSEIHAMGQGAYQRCKLAPLAEPGEAGRQRQGPVGPAFEAARTVLRSSMARVMGPTPPIRGVIQPATSLTDSSTSDNRVRPRHDVPAPTTAAPGFTMSGVTSP